MRISTINMDILNEIMDKNEHFGRKCFFKVLCMCAPWKKCGQKMKIFEIFFDIIDNYACLYLLTKFRQNWSKIGHVNVRSSKVHQWIFSKRTILNYPMHE